MEAWFRAGFLSSKCISELRLCYCVAKWAVWFLLCVDTPRHLPVLRAGRRVLSGLGLLAVVVPERHCS